MRPIRLDLEGFASFRQPTTIDFTDADLFVLSGPTGSGKCLPGDTPVYDGVTGRRIRLDDAVKQQLPSVIGFAGGKVTPVPVSDWLELGSQPTVRVMTRTAQTLIAAATHPIMTDRGLVKAGELKPGDWVAHVSHLNIDPPKILTDDEALLLGLLLGDGSIARGHTIKFSNADDDVVQLFRDLLHGRWPNAIVRRDGRGISYGISNPKGRDCQRISHGIVAELEARDVDLREYLHAGNLAQTRRGERAIPLGVIRQAGADLGIDLVHLVDRLYPSQALRAWLDSLQVAQETTGAKRIPAGVVLQGGSVALNLLSGLIQTDGWCSVTRDGRRGQIGFSSSSPDLAHDFRTVATSCGLATHLSVKHIGGRNYWSVDLDVDAARSAGPMLRLVGKKADARDRVLALLDEKPRTVSQDRIPPSFNTTLTSGGQYGPRRLKTQSLDRATFLELGGEPSVARAETRWVKIQAVEPDEDTVCYDLTVDTPEHLYVADGWIVHNSSVIDAITFCLYGIVARYDDKRVVEPVISKGRNEARVALQFSANGVNHTAVRVVRRSKGGGASTKEARLERWRGDDPDDARPIAATAAEVSDVVADLLGLGYDHFTRTVVLPQGAFQEFLHGSKSERATLLNELLAIGIFDTVARQARTRAATLDGQVGELKARLHGDLTPVSDEQVTAVENRIATLDDAISMIEEATPKLEEILATGRRQAETVTELQRRANALEGISPPEGLDELVTAGDTARQALEAATEEVTAAEQARDQADEVVDELPSRDAVAAQRDRIAQRAKVSEDHATCVQTVATATTARDEAAAAQQAATVDLETARDHVEAARRDDMVGAIAEDLHPGDDCPVCRRPLQDPVEVGGGNLKQAQQAHDRAATRLEEARAATTRADRELSRVEARLEHLGQRRDDLDGQVREADLPTARDDLDGLAEQVRTAVAQRDATRTRVKRVRTQRDQAVTRNERIATDLAEARRGLTRARDHVADQQPPPLDSDDLAGSWQALMAWATTQRTAVASELAVASDARETSRTHYREAMRNLHAAVADTDVDMTSATAPGDLRDAHLKARHDANSQLDALVQRQEQRAGVLADLEERRQQQAVATQLGRLLDKNNFQRWLTTRAVRHLVVRATRHLDQLSGGAYSLTLDDNADFAIIDHHNGGERRPARSLSGGETFLASLSLALALSESVADLAAGGAARLESLFIDEGFGTLDVATIDVVRAALEELGSTGRMVGIVTHVPALAEQLPVQFKVRKQAQVSTIERIDV